jgi:aminobenzoyl-glutamate transport protein
VVSSVLLIVVCTLVSEPVVEPRLGAYRGEVPAESGGDVSPEETRGLRLALFLSGEPLRDQQTGAIVGNTPS